VQRASTLFTEEDRQRINEAVATAEGKTSAEIVPAVATSSGRYDRPEDVVGLWFACITLALVWWLLPGKPAAGDWGGLSGAWHVLILIGSAVAAFVLGAIVASQLGWLRRLFTPLEQMQEEVSTRARQVFYDQRVHHTVGAGGILVYVSLYEHMAAIIADQTVLEKLSENKVAELCIELTQRLGDGSATDAMCLVIHKIGDLLSDLLPRETGDVDELPNALVLVDE
jgi:putative membrane protein